MKKYAEWQIQIRAEMMRNGWGTKELHEELKNRGVELPYNIIRASLSKDSYIGAGRKMCAALGIELDEQDMPRYLYPRNEVF